MTPEQLAVEIAKHLPHGNSRDISLEDAQFWCRVAEILTDDQLAAFIHVIHTLGSPISMLLREMVIAKHRSESNVQ